MGTYKKKRNIRKTNRKKMYKKSLKRKKRISGGISPSVTPISMGDRPIGGPSERPTVNKSIGALPPLGGPPLGSPPLGGPPLGGPRPGASSSKNVGVKDIATRATKKAFEKNKQQSEAITEAYTTEQMEKDKIEFLDKVRTITSGLEDLNVNSIDKKQRIDLNMIIDMLAKHNAAILGLKRTLTLQYGKILEREKTSMNKIDQKLASLSSSNPDKSRKSRKSSNSTKGIVSNFLSGASSILNE